MSSQSIFAVTGFVVIVEGQRIVPVSGRFTVEVTATAHSVGLLFFGGVLSSDGPWSGCYAQGVGALPPCGGLRVLSSLASHGYLSIELGVASMSGFPENFGWVVSGESGPSEVMPSRSASPSTATVVS